MTLITQNHTCHMPHVTYACDPTSAHCSLLSCSLLTTTLLTHPNQAPAVQHVHDVRRKRLRALAFGSAGAGAGADTGGLQHAQRPGARRSGGANCWEACWPRVLLGSFGQRRGWPLGETLGKPWPPPLLGSLLGIFVHGWGGARRATAAKPSVRHTLTLPPSLTNSPLPCPLPLPLPPPVPHEQYGKTRQ